MSSTQYLKIYSVALISFLALDAIWLGVLARDFYQRHLGHILAEKPNWSAAALFYAIFVAGIVYFCIIPSHQDNSLGRAIFRGAFFGLVTYAAYDLTNHAVVKDWPGMVTAVDLTWGATISATVSTVGYIYASSR